jgi:peptidoglycan DL-endopeptidase CwlO
MQSVNGSRRNVSLVLLASLLLTLVFAPFASASPISAKKARLREVEAKLQKVYDKADMAVEKYNQANSQLQTIQQQITENQHLLKVARYNLSIARSQLESRAATLYKTRDVGFVDVILRSSSFDDLVTQMDAMQRFGISDVNTVKAISSYGSDIKDRRIKLVADQKVAAKLVTERTAQKNEVLAVQHQLESMTRGIKAEIKQAEDAQAAAARAAAAAASNGVTDPGTGTPPSGNIDPGGPGHPEIVALAQAQLGKPYVWGGAGPNVFDCSGLAMYCYAQIGIGLSHGATDQQRASHPVSLNNLAPGDLVFFGSASYSHHVGIYVGGGSMIDAPHSGAVVRYDSIGGAWIGGRF